MRLLFISDFTEQFPYNLLRGILKYSQETEPWAVQKMSPAMMRIWGIPAMADWALRWKADIVIGQFDPEDDLTLFTRHGILVFAQDYKEKFRYAPNITGDYVGNGRMAADYYAGHGFKHFAFIGYHNACWSEERQAGFISRVHELGEDNDVSVYNGLSLDRPWYNEAEKIALWLRGLPKPVGVFACDDNVANLVLEIGSTNGIKIPSDVSVLGVDDDDVMCNLTSPTLSSIKVDIPAGGYKAAEQAVKMIQNKVFNGPDIVLEQVEVVSRGSTSLYATTDTAVLRALDFIRDNIHHHINVQDVLEAVPVSRRLLEIRFKNVTGTTLYHYISDRRIEYFAEKLITTKDTISEIAFDMDEPDVKSITRRFKALKGCSPSEYRESHLRKL